MQGMLKAKPINGSKTMLRKKVFIQKSRNGAGQSGITKMSEEFYHTFLESGL